MRAYFVRDLAGGDLAEASAVPFSLLPLGSLEYHGAHAPIGTDTILADGFARALARRRACLVFPTLSYGFVPRLTTDQGPGAGVPPEVQLAHLTAVLRSVRSFGPRRILLLNGHSENQYAARLAAETLAEEDGDASVAIVNWWKLAETPWRDDPHDPWADAGGHGHGGPLEISVAASFEADGVRPPADTAHDVPYEAPWWRGAAQVVGRGQAPEGFAGYHGRVSAIDVARGRRIAEQVADALAGFVDGWLARADADPR
jgi:creatinine amidohydrolase